MFFDRRKPVGLFVLEFSLSSSPRHCPQGHLAAADADSCLQLLSGYRVE